MRMVKLLLILAAFGVSSCERENPMPHQPSDQTATQIEEFPKHPRRIVAKVNGRPIYNDELNRKTLEDVITNEILYERGLKQGLDQKYKEKIEDFKKKIVVYHVMRELYSKIPKEVVTAEEIEQYYKDNESNYIYILADEISVMDKNIAHEIHRKAVSGEDFEKLNSEYSSNGIDINLRKSQSAKRYNKYFKSIKVGEVSDVVPEYNKRSKFVKVSDEKPEYNQFKILKIVEIRKLPLSSQNIAESIKSALIAKKQSEAINNMAQQIKDEDKIKVDILINEKR
jgi:hypothetical protein